MITIGFANAIENSIKDAHSNKTKEVIGHKPYIHSIGANIQLDNQTLFDSQGNPVLTVGSILYIDSQLCEYTNDIIEVTPELKIRQSKYNFIDADKDECIAEKHDIEWYMVEPSTGQWDDVNSWEDLLSEKITSSQYPESLLPAGTIAKNSLTSSLRVPSEAIGKRIAFSYRPSSRITVPLAQGPTMFVWDLDYYFGQIENPKGKSDFINAGQKLARTETYSGGGVVNPLINSPEIKNVTLEGEFKVNGRLTAQYDFYSHTDYEFEDRSLFWWGAFGTTRDKALFESETGSLNAISPALTSEDVGQIYEVSIRPIKHENGFIVKGEVVTKTTDGEFEVEVEEPFRAIKLATTVYPKNAIGATTVHEYGEGFPSTGFYSARFILFAQDEPNSAAVRNNNINNNKTWQWYVNGGEIATSSTPSINTYAMVDLNGFVTLLSEPPSDGVIEIYAQKGSVRKKHSFSISQWLLTSRELNTLKLVPLAEAQNICDSRGLRLPTIEELTPRLARNNDPNNSNGNSYEFVYTFPDERFYSQWGKLAHINTPYDPITGKALSGNLWMAHQYYWTSSMTTTNRPISMGLTDTGSWLGETNVARNRGVTCVKSTELAIAPNIDNLKPYFGSTQSENLPVNGIVLGEKLSATYNFEAGTNPIDKSRYEWKHLETGKVVAYGVATSAQNQGRIPEYTVSASDIGYTLELSVQAYDLINKSGNTLKYEFKDIKPVLQTDYPKIDSLKIVSRNNQPYVIGTDLFLTYHWDLGFTGKSHFKEQSNLIWSLPNGENRVVVINRDDSTELASGVMRDTFELEEGRYTITAQDIGSIIQVTLEAKAIGNQSDVYIGNTLTAQLGIPTHNPMSAIKLSYTAYPKNNQGFETQHAFGKGYPSLGFNGARFLLMAQDLPGSSQANSNNVTNNRQWRWRIDGGLPATNTTPSRNPYAMVDYSGWVTLLAEPPKGTIIHITAERNGQTKEHSFSLDKWLVSPRELNQLSTLRHDPAKALCESRGLRLPLQEELSGVREDSTNPDRSFGASNNAAGRAIIYTYPSNDYFSQWGSLSQFQTRYNPLTGATVSGNHWLTNHYWTESRTKTDKVIYVGITANGDWFGEANMNNARATACIKSL